MLVGFSLFRDPKVHQNQRITLKNSVSIILIPYRFCPNTDCPFTFDGLDSVKTQPTCMPLFTLLRVDVTSNPTPYGGLPGNTRERTGRRSAVKLATCTPWT